MKIELIKETEINGDVYYRVLVNGSACNKFSQLFHEIHKQSAEQYFDDLIKGKTKTIETIKSIEL